MIEVQARIPHAVIYISDRENTNEETPENKKGNLVAVTTSCISIGTCPPMDGVVTIRIMESKSQLEGIKVFEGYIETPEHNLSVSTSELKVLASVSVLSEKTKIEIWANDDREPTIINIVLNS